MWELERDFCLPSFFGLGALYRPGFSSSVEMVCPPHMRACAARSAGPGRATLWSVGLGLGLSANFFRDILFYFCPLVLIVKLNFLLNLLQ